MANTGKRVAQLRIHLTKRSIERLEPATRPWIAWDTDITGFGIRVYPSGKKSYLVSYRVGDGGRLAPSHRLVIGRYPLLTPSQARRIARELLGKVAAGGNPAHERLLSRSVPTIGEAFADYVHASPELRTSTVSLYQGEMNRYFGDWLKRPLSSIRRKDVEERFVYLTTEKGWSVANRSVTLLRAVFRRAYADHPNLPNPIEAWFQGGGRLNRTRRRRIPAPADVLPMWQRGFRKAVPNAVVRDCIRFGLFTGLRLQEVLHLSWRDIVTENRSFVIPHTKTGQPLWLPLTSQLSRILGSRRRGNQTEWVFNSPIREGHHLTSISHLYEPISTAAGTEFWFHALRNCFITVAERDLMLPRSLVKRLVNHAPSNDVTENYASAWTLAQLRGPAQQIADRIAELSTKSLRGNSTLVTARPVTESPVPMITGRMMHNPNYRQH